MSVRYSKFRLNSFAATAYFQAHCPPGYPVSRVLIESRAFRNLPPRLRELARLSKAWLRRQASAEVFLEEVSRWYDAEGDELDPETGRRLSVPEILAEWGEEVDTLPPMAADILLPPGGFADPLVWEPAPMEDVPEIVDRTGLTVAQILSDIASRGRCRTADEYGVPPGWLPGMRNDEELAEAILGMHGKPWPERFEQS